MDEDLRLSAIEASKFFKRGKYEEAVDICTLGISDYPQYSSLYLLLAKSYIALGNVNEAYKVFEAANKFFVNDPLINTLKDILELTPSISSSESVKKKTKSAEPASIENIPIQIEKEDLILDDQNVLEIESTIPEIQTSDLVSNFENDVLEKEITPEEFDFAIDTEEEVVAEETTLEEFDFAMDTEEVVVAEVEEEITEVSNLESVEHFETVSNNLVSEKDVEENQNPDSIKYDDFEEEEFNSIVSNLTNLSTKDFSNENTSKTNEIVKEDNISLTFPKIDSSYSNFVSKSKNADSISSMQNFEKEKEQLKSLLPSIEDSLFSIQKYRPTEPFVMELVNPVSNNSMDNFSSIVAEKIGFTDTHSENRTKYKDPLQFENPQNELFIESITILKTDVNTNQ